MELDIKLYHFAPVQAVIVTQKNMVAVAEWCGGIIEETQAKYDPTRTTRYIDVPTPSGARMERAFPGMIVARRLTRTKDGQLLEAWSVFAKNYFMRNYFESAEAGMEFLASDEKEDLWSWTKYTEAPVLAKKFSKSSDKEIREATNIVNVVGTTNPNTQIGDAMTRALHKSMIENRA